MKFSQLLIIASAYLARYADSFKSISSSVSRCRTQQVVVMDSLHSDDHQLIPKSLSDSVTASTKKAFPAYFAGPIISLLAAVATSRAEETVEAPAKVELGPVPTDFGLKYNDYYSDCQSVVNHMRYASQMEKGNPLLAEIAQKTKDEMNDFVSYYRRFSGISGKQSFSLLYTSINVLAGHYTSYGIKFPVPEKRKKRLLQEFNDIEKNIRKKR
mmetsp:Transcript_31286/g.44982  ORF Transcript_31286/g.44982 Transcript_31286/m.44982 type:complete len:213 (-) Transcript_31286:2561-3199(-)